MGSERRGLRFLHPPRTGGSSIKRAWGLDRREYLGHRFPRLGDGWSYGFTRNPWDRAVSLYTLAYRPGHEPHSFADFVRSGFKAEASFGPKFPERLACPTIRWLKDADWVGRFETREEDLRTLSHTLSRPYPDEWIARSPSRGPYQEYYDDELREMVGEFYREDIEHFGYVFEGAPCLTR